MSDSIPCTPVPPTVPAPIAAALDMVVAWWQAQRRGPELALLEAIAVLQSQGYGMIPPPSANGSVVGQEVPTHG